MEPLPHEPCGTEPRYDVDSEGAYVRAFCPRCDDGTDLCANVPDARAQWNRIQEFKKLKRDFRLNGAGL